MTNKNKSKAIKKHRYYNFTFIQRHGSGVHIITARNDKEAREQLAEDVGNCRSNEYSLDEDTKEYAYTQ